MHAYEGEYAAQVVERLSDDFSGLALRNLQTLTPSAGQVLLRVRAAALNFPDVLLTQGNYQFKPAPPFVPGLEAPGALMQSWYPRYPNPRRCTT